MSLESLFKRKVRTILTVLGVVIGTTSIVVMISLGIGMKSAMLSSMESWGSLTMIEVNSGNRYYSEDSSSGKEQEELRLDDALIETLSRLEYVESVDPVLQTQVIIRMGIYQYYGQLVGMPSESFREMKVPIGEGHLPEAGGELEFLYGNTIRQDFMNTRTNRYDYWETGELPNVDLMKEPAYVIFDTEGYARAGVVDEKTGQTYAMPKKYIIPAAGIVAGGPDDWNQFSYSIYCDIDALKMLLKREFKGKVIPGQPQQRNGKPYKEIFYSTLRVNVVDMEHVTQVQQIINDMGYQTYAQAEWIESDMQMMNIIQAVLGGIGGISLFVAAIGITNTMMMSIYERTKEIGIMKVIGCRIRDIQALFLTEAGYIGAIGGTLGVGLSYLLSYIANKALVGADIFGTGEPMDISVIPPWLSLLSIVFAILIAMLAGFFPSIRAMRLSPLAAIRAE